MIWIQNIYNMFYLLGENLKTKPIISLVILLVLYFLSY